MGNPGTAAGTAARAGIGLAAAFVLFRPAVDHADLLAAAQAARSALVTILPVHVASEREVTGKRRFRRFPRHGSSEETLRHHTRMQAKPNQNKTKKQKGRKQNIIV